MEPSNLFDSGNGMQRPARTIALIFAVACFAVTVVNGVTVERPLRALVFEGLGIFFVTWLIGSGVSTLMMWAVEHALDDHRAQHPIPAEDPFAADAEAGREILV